jgi:hypothetical protein
VSVNPDHSRPATGASPPPRAALSNHIPAHADSPACVCTSACTAHARFPYATTLLTETLTIGCHIRAVRGVIQV